MADICRFYLQGYCRYGDQCRYKHVRDHDRQSNNDYGYNQRQSRHNFDYYGDQYDNDSGNAYDNRSKSGFTRASDFNFIGSHSRNSQHSRFQDQQSSPFHYNKTDQNKDKSDVRDVSAGDITATVLSEMKDWLINGTWLHSCYACAKYLPNIPLFEDFSQEELRLKAYECKLANKFVEYEYWVNKLTSDKREALAQFQQHSSHINKQLADYINSVKSIQINDDGSGTVVSANTFSFTSSSINTSNTAAAAPISWPSAQQTATFPTTAPKPAGVFSFTEGKYVSELPKFGTNISQQATAGAQGSVYSELSKLTLADRNEFEASQFSLGKIPLCPPPRELV